jgi:hypothetical protein
VGEREREREADVDTPVPFTPGGGSVIMDRLQETGVGVWRG